MLLEVISKPSKPIKKNPLKSKNSLTLEFVHDKMEGEETKPKPKAHSMFGLVKG